MKKLETKMLGSPMEQMWRKCVPVDKNTNLRCPKAPVCGMNGFPYTSSIILEDKKRIAWVTTPKQSPRFDPQGVSQSYQKSFH